jgi:hypothetical protein
MSASPTTVPAVKQKLLELFKAAVTEQTEVWPHRVSEDHQLNENIYLGAVRGRRKWVTLSPTPGPNSREEEYSVLFEVEIYRQGTDETGAETRLFEIVQALELAIAEHRTFDGLNNVQWGIVGEFQQDTKTGTDGVLTTYTAGVNVTARI